MSEEHDIIFQLKVALLHEEERANTAEALVERLRKDLADPPPDVQERVIKKLGLVRKDAVRELVHALEVCDMYLPGATRAKRLNIQKAFAKAKEALKDKFRPRLDSHGER